MYCNYCRALNPNDAIYCSSCGQTIQPPVERHAKRQEGDGLDSAVPNGDVVPARERQTDNVSSADYRRMPREELERPLPHTSPSAASTEDVPTNQTDLTFISSAAAIESATLPRTTHPPYARFILQVLASGLLMSVGIFAIFESLARNTTAFTVLGISLLFAFALAWSAWRTWERILISEPQSEPRAKRRHRNVLGTIVVIGLLYFGLSALLGSVIGQDRAESMQFVLDTAHEKELASRISKARSGVEPNIVSNLRMYAAIEPEVKDYALTLWRLKTDLGVYDSKFPAQHGQTTQYQASVEREIRRAELLTKQMAVAKQIEAIDESQRWEVWQRDMAPLLKEEDGLDQSR